MSTMISSALKPAVTKVINPVARLALRAGLTPNQVTTFGTLATLTSALYFYPREDFFLGTLVISLLILSDLFDGAMARISDKGPSAWGAFLDSTLDRIADAALLIGLAIALVKNEDGLVYVVLAALVTGFLIPYIRAKAEALSIECSVGIAERTERLIIVLVAIGFHGLGVPYILAIGMWLLAGLGVVTTLQRVYAVHKGLQ